MAAPIRPENAVNAHVHVVRTADLTEMQRSEMHRLQVSCFSDVPYEELMEDFVAEPFARVLAYLGDDLAGCVSVFKREIAYEGRRVVLGGFGGTCTRDDLRRRGIGTRVCRAAAGLLREEGCDVAFLAAAPGTERFYGQVGFVPLATPRQSESHVWRSVPTRAVPSLARAAGVSGLPRYREKALATRQRTLAARPDYGREVGAKISEAKRRVSVALAQAAALAGMG